MSVTVELPAEALLRLETEATHRGISIDEVIAELAASLPIEDPLESFLECGASGDTRPFDIHRERAELADRQLTDGA